MCRSKLKSHPTSSLSTCQGRSPHWIDGYYFLPKKWPQSFKGGASGVPWGILSLLSFLSTWHHVWLYYATFLKCWKLEIFSHHLRVWGSRITSSQWSVLTLHLSQVEHLTNQSSYCQCWWFLCPFSSLLHTTSGWATSELRWKGRKEQSLTCLSRDLPHAHHFLYSVSKVRVPEVSLPNILLANRFQCITGFERQGSRCLILIIVLRENVFHTSDILDDNSFGQVGWKITFLRLAPVAAFIRRRSLLPLYSITLQFEAESLGWKMKKKILWVPALKNFFKATCLFEACQEDFFFSG